MGFKTFIENIRHNITPASPAETVRHNAALAAINTAHAAADARELINHGSNVAHELARHAFAPHDIIEDFRYSLSSIGENARHDLYVGAYDLWY